VRGGYKALRSFLLASFEHHLAHTPLLVLSGATGVGKTGVLRQVPRHIDLEGHAKHRGSAFGPTLEPQPAQISWENAVAIDLLKLVQGGAARQPVLLEDESRLIGQIHLPPLLQQSMRAAPRVVLEASLDERILAISRDYIEEPWQQYRQRFGDSALPQFSIAVLHNLQRIRKRLGEERHARITQLFVPGLAALPRGDLAAFHAGIRILLQEYYDPLYDYQLQQHREGIVFRGERGAVLDWLAHHMAQAT